MSQKAPESSPERNQKKFDFVYLGDSKFRSCELSATGASLCPNLLSFFQDFSEMCKL